MRFEITGSPRGGNRVIVRARCMESRLAIIYEDDDLLVLNKPADLVCHPTKGDVYSSLISRVRLHLGEASHPQLINRLDRETSGVVLVAKTETAARELRRIWEDRAVQKEYVAIVRGHMTEDQGVIEAPLGKAEQSPVAIKDTVRADGSPSQTEYWVERRFTRAEGDFTVLQVQPRTGRKHQIRIHLAHVGHPIVGDKLYGEDEQLYLALVEGRLTEADRNRLLLPCQALHACSVRLQWRGKPWEFHAEPEAWFSGFIEGKNLTTDGHGLEHCDRQREVN